MFNVWYTSDEWPVKLWTLACSHWAYFYVLLYFYSMQGTNVRFYTWEMVSFQAKFCPFCRRTCGMRRFKSLACYNLQLILCELLWPYLVIFSIAESSNLYHFHISSSCHIMSLFADCLMFGILRANGPYSCELRRVAIELISIFFYNSTRCKELM